jgi:hypothetical protein
MVNGLYAGPGSTTHDNIVCRQEAAVGETVPGDRSLRAGRRLWLWLAGVLLLAAGWKAILAVGLGGGWAVPFNADEAVVALMARHILQGARPVFFYGQAYMGSLDALLVAVGFAALGQEIWVIRLVQGLLYLGTLATTAVLGKEIFGSWKTGVLAAWLLAIPAVNVSLYTTVSLGGYGEMLVLGNLILLTALRIAIDLKSGDEQERSWSRPWSAKSPDFAPRRWESSHSKTGWYWFLFGLLAGLGLWAFGLTLVYSLPAAAYLAWAWWRARNCAPELRGNVIIPLALLVAGAIVGAAPWVSYALAAGPHRLVAELGGSAIAGAEGLGYPAQLGRHLFNLLLIGIPAVFGLRPPWEVRWLALPLMPVALAFWLGVIVYVPVRIWKLNYEGTVGHNGFNRQDAKGAKVLYIRKNLASFAPWLFDLSQARPSGMILLVLVIFTLVAGFVLTPFGVDPSGRYFLPLAIPLALFAGDLLRTLRRAWGRWAWGLAALILAFNLCGTLESAARFPPGLTTQIDAQTDIDHRADRDLIAFLEAQGETRGYSHYWVAYPLAFQSGEALIFAPRLPYHPDLRYTERDDRYAPYRAEVARAERVAYITTGQAAVETRLRSGLQNLTIAWEEAEIGDYRVFYNLSRPAHPEELGLSASPGQAMSAELDSTQTSADGR